MTTVMDPDIPRKEPRAYIPHAFTKEELQNFFTACDSISAAPPTEEQLSRRITVPVFFRLLYSSGIRTNEARALMREDVDLDSGVVNIRYSKGHVQHYVVLHHSMLLLMRQYDGAIDKMYPDRVYFFPARKRNGGFHRASWVQRNFKKMWRQHNCGNVVPYALRPYLMRHMGHKLPESFQYYFHLSPPIRKEVSQIKKSLDWMIPDVPEVPYE
ncbi:tyrosine-type recombinase/integrase [Dehalobacterium formicoaceticum]|uniref:Tyrosine-type recombinase/integrase n=2 Tax=Dehalobacterium formicoaceticum TaxID=51515 RepID=A0ABT1Y810_9FIRM|nr:tyrosine-type recombinase/integrase [Dehalobacterium formicoaceticum]MCR6547025.1 tyrosine-type recombinase/integrase [Dehalobacterium formicoaceticum]